MENSQIYTVSNTDKLSDTTHNNDDVYLIYQYFIHNNKERCNEIKYCLKQNVKLGLFKKIILLNERIYTKEELGLNNDEMKHIVQININHRIKYNNVFYQTFMLNLRGYIVLCNADIFFDETIINVRKSCLSQTKSVYTLIRFEYNNEKNLQDCKLFYDTKGWSQDVWIYHTSQMSLNNDFIEKTNFMLGLPGCDNRIAYIFTENGFRCINEPYNVKTYHYHKTQIRNYTIKDTIKPPYLYIKHIYRDTILKQENKMDSIIRNMGIDPSTVDKKKLKQMVESIKQGKNPLEKRETKNNTDRVKVGRNDKCPCLSGKKYKNCCL